MEGYRTIAAPAQEEFVEKRSRFIGQIAPVEGEEEALAFINAVRERHREATHNVYAYILRENQMTRFSDDGEPQGTAGKPVLEVVQREGLVDVAVVVTRYFGGVLLGAGGLLEVDMGYDFYGKATYILPKHEVQLLESVFEEGVRLRLLCKKARLPALTQELRELSSGTVAPLVTEEKFAHFPEG